MKYENVCFHKTESVDDLEKDFVELVKLHQLRWESRGLPGSFSGGKFPIFQKEVMKCMLENGNLELWFLSVLGINIAALYNIRYKDKIYFYQAGIDVEFDKTLSPGMLIHFHCMQKAIIDGLKEYDFMLMGVLDSYKKRWTNNSRIMHDYYIAFPSTIKMIMSARYKAKNCYHTIKKMWM